MTARIYYYPDDDGTLETIDLLSDLSDLQPRQAWQQDATDSIGGGQFVITHAMWHEVVVRLDSFDDAPLASHLYSLESHLSRGGYVGVSEAHGKSWAGYCRSRPQRGDTVLRTRGNQFHNAAASLAAGDYIVISSAHPDYRTEHCLVASVSGNKITLDATTPIRGSFGRLPVLVRHEGYWPAMMRPLDGREPIITTNRRKTWTLAMTLREDWEAIRAVAQSTGAIQGSTQGGGLTMDAIVKRARAR